MRAALLALTLLVPAWAAAAGESSGLPDPPAVERFSRPWQSPGRPGGELTMLMARARDCRLVYVYGYARLAGYDPDFNIAPDILADFAASPDDRVFTLRLRANHRWSDGAPFTAEDFRYWWEDMANNRERYPGGPPAELLVDDEPPAVTFPDPLTVRYAWSRPNPFFPALLAAAKPLEIYAPAHYLKQFHPRYAEPAALARRIADARQKTWAQLHNRLDDLTEFNNPDLPTLQPWVPKTAPPSERFVFERNPYYHRVDGTGQRLPYIDRLVLRIADSRLIPAKAGAGEPDIQARYLRFDNYTFLKRGAAANRYDVRLWQTGTGAQLALFPNLNAADPVWRAVLRDVRFRRALSLSINRDEINQVIYFGLARPSANTVLPRSPLWRADYQERWTAFDPQQAGRLLDAMGLDRRNGDGDRLLPDGRPLHIIIDAAGDSSEEADALELVADSWRRLGVRLFARVSQLDVFRKRIYSGDTIMAIGRGVDNAAPTAAMSPAEFVPLDQAKYQWPRWGQYAQTSGREGEAPDMAEARALLAAFDDWRRAEDDAGRLAAWRTILEINADQAFTIGMVNGAPQPVTVRHGLRNLPDEGFYSYEPGAHFGLYRPDGWWFDNQEGR